MKNMMDFSACKLQLQSYLRSGMAQCIRSESYWNLFRWM